MQLISARTRRLIGETILPGDKSLSHRAALLASLAEGPSRIRNFLSAGVTDVMLSSLSELGVKMARRRNALTIQGIGLAGFEAPGKAMNCGNSATTIRLLAGGLAAAGTPAVLDGSDGLRARPMKRIVEPLQQMGVPIRASPAGTAPLTLEGRGAARRLKSLDHTLPVASAQVKSCLLLAALAADGETVLREPGPSRDHTERMLRGMGAAVVSERQDHAYVTRIQPAARLAPIDYTVPGDMSAAAFLIVAALIVREGRLTLRGVGLNPTRTGLIDVLRSMGADIAVKPRGERCGEPIGDLTVCSSSLQAAHVSGELVVRMIDEFPIFAVAAAFAKGRTV
jgi:3-phosphoshikimate 1-carboxyvinyltransferase